MDQNLKEKTLDLLTRAEDIAIAVSESAGFDGLAAGLALHLALAKLGKNASILAPSPSVSDAQKLYAVDKIGRTSDKNNLVVVVSRAVENVDKVTYFLDGDKLKIVVHPLPGSIGVAKDQISFEQSPVKPNLVFAVGLKSADELKNKVAHEQILDPNIWIVSIDKEELNQKFAQVHLFDPETASFSELTAQLVSDLALPIDEDIAYNLYAGIAQVTDNFSLPKSTPKTFQIASMLVKFGANKASLSGVSQVATPRKVSAGPSSGLQLPKYDFSSDLDQMPIEEVEKEKDIEDWLKPPKIYKGSKSLDKEN